MSNIIPPMVSSTPPPMEDDNAEDDDEEDFGDFTTADLSYDLSQPSKPPFNSAWEENITRFSDAPECDHFSDALQPNGTTHLVLDFEADILDDKSNGDCVASSSQRQEANTSQGSVVSTGTDSGLCSVSPNSVATSPVPQADQPDRTSPCREDSSSSDDTIVKSSHTDAERTLPSSTPFSDISYLQLAETEVTLDETTESILSQTKNILNDINAQHLVNKAQLSETDTNVKPVSPSIVFQSENEVYNFQSPVPSPPSNVDHDDSLGENCVTFSSDKPSHNGHITTPVASASTDSGSVFDVQAFEAPENYDEPQVLSENIKIASTTESSCNTLQNALLKEDESFDEFSAYDHTAMTVDKLEFPIEQRNLSVFENETIASGDVDFTIEDDDEFSDFASSAVAVVSDPAPTSLFPIGPSTPASHNSSWAGASASQLSTVTNVDEDFDDDDFDSFETATATTQSCDNSQASAAHLAVVVTTMFPGGAGMDAIAAGEPVAERARIVDGNAVWGNLRDVDTSHALSYQWLSSTANKMLLTALGIDARNILFGPKWNICVPRFAANLSVSPLQPVLASIPVTLVPTVEPTPQTAPRAAQEIATTLRAEAVVPEAQFDWISSGLVNPLDYVAEISQRTSAQENGAINNGQWLLANVNEPTISTEAARCIAGLPDISFMRSKSLVTPQHRSARLLS